MPTTLEFHDIKEGLLQRAGPYRVSEAEIIEFAQRWDPRLLHTDQQVAEAGPFNGLTASSSHTLAVRTLLLFKLSPPFPSLVATMGWQDLRLPNPVRPDDQLTLTLTWLDKRISSSKPDFGILRQSVTMVNQNGSIVLDYVDTVGMKILPLSNA